MEEVPQCPRGHGPKERRHDAHGWARWRCPACHREDMARWRREHPGRRRALVAEELVRRGGACEHSGCDWEEDLEWHHRDPASKLFDITGSWGGRTNEEVLAELTKCDLLCPNHHRLAHRTLREAAAV